MLNTFFKLKDMKRYIRLKNIFGWLIGLMVGISSAQAQVVWSEDFNSGGGNWTLNQTGGSIGLTGGPANTGTNTWVVDANGAGGPALIDGSFLHITCSSFICTFLGLEWAYLTNDAANVVAIMNSAIPGATLSGGPYVLRFNWACAGLAGDAFGRLIYSINGGPWQVYSAVYVNQGSSWQLESIDLATLGWNPGNSLRLGFWWVNQANPSTGQDPAFGVDLIRIETSTPTNTITTSNVNPTVYCPGDNITVNFTSTGTFNAGNIYTAQLSDATGSFAAPVTLGTLNSTANSGTINGTIPGGTPAGTGYKIRVVSSNPAVTGTEVGPITINQVISNPSVSITANPGTTICTGDNVTFTATPSGIGSLTPTYQWTVNGNPVGNNSPTFSSTTLQNGDQVQVSITVNGPCNNGNASSNTLTMNVTAGSPASVSIDVSPNDTVCAGTNLVFTATPTNGGANPSYQWTVNGNNVGSNSAVFTSASLQNGDVVQVTMTSTSACLQGPATVSSNTITIVFGLQASCSTVGALEGQPATVNVSISGGAQPYTFTVTNFGDNSNDTQNNVNATSTSFTHVYATAGTYNVQVTVTDANGCTATTTCTMNITSVNTQLPIADFTANPVTGCGTVTVNFTNTSQFAASYQWDFGDGSTSTDTDPSHTYTGAGTYNVTLIAINPNGNDTLFVPNLVTVYPEVDAGAIALDACLGEPTYFTDASISATSWDWDFGDGSPNSALQNPSHTYADTGTYTVTLTVQGLGGCADTYTFTTRVSDKPTAQFDTVSTAANCNDVTVTFTNQSAGATTYFWDFGDSQFSSDPNPTHTYSAAGNYAVKLVAINGVCETEIVKNYLFNTLTTPNADIEGPRSAITGDNLTFNNLTTNATSATIDFGDGSAPQNLTPPFNDLNYSYPNQGTYTITLTAFNGTCTDVDTLIINVQEPQLLIIPNAFTPNADGLNDTWYPIARGAKTHETSIYNRWGQFIINLKPNDQWDGKANGKPCPEGVYFYHIEGEFNNGKKFKRSGSVTLIR